MRNARKAKVKIMKLCATMYSQVSPTDKNSNGYESKKKFESTCFSNGKMPKSCQVSPKRLS